MHFEVCDYFKGLVDGAMVLAVPPIAHEGSSRNYLLFFRMLQSGAPNWLAVRHCIHNCHIGLPSISNHLHTLERPVRLSWYVMACHAICMLLCHSSSLSSKSQAREHQHGLIPPHYHMQVKPTACTCHFAACLGVSGAQRHLLLLHICHRLFRKAWRGEVFALVISV